MMKNRLPLYLVLIVCFSKALAQNKQDSLIAHNKKAITKLKNRITTIENIGNGHNAYLDEIVTLKALVKKQHDSIILLNNIINDNLVSKYNSANTKTTKELNDDLNGSKLVNDNLSDCHCVRLFFNKAQTKINYTEFKTLDSIATIIKTNPNLKIKLSGHADKTGNEEKNIVYSKFRVLNLKDYFITQKHISPSAFTTEWHGSAIPSKDAMDIDKQFLNRRAEISIE